MLKHCLFYLFIALSTCFSHAAVKPLSVSDSQVLIGGERGSLAGNSLFWSNSGWGGNRFYTEEFVHYLKHEWHSDVIRVALGVEKKGGLLSHPEENLQRVHTIIKAAIAQDMYVIVDWHSHAAEKNLQQAQTFFADIAKQYGHYNNIIYEIYNEPLKVDWNTVIKPYAEQVIKTIRDIDPDNLIVVGTPFWSQRVDEAARNPINANNIAYTLHFYAGSHGDNLRKLAIKAMDKGIALFVTEWGTVNANGDGQVATDEVQEWMAFLKKHNLSHVNWAVNDKLEGASIFQANQSLAKPKKLRLSESGKQVKSIIKQWPDTPSYIINAGGK